MLELKGVRKTFGERTVLSDVNLSLSSGERLGIIGPNGAGKTTLLRILCGLSTYEGSATYNGREISAMRMEGAAVLNTPLLPRMSVRRSAVLASCRILARENPREVTKRAHALFAEFGFSTEMFSRTPGRLSSGQRQKATLVVTLLASFRLGVHVLLLDEAFSGLDASAKAEVIPCLKAFLERTTLSLILVSHAAEDITALCDRVVVLGDGRIVEEGRSADIAASAQSVFAQKFFQPN